jgi:hypothetical protein
MLLYLQAANMLRGKPATNQPESSTHRLLMQHHKQSQQHKLQLC